jgi:hypothetical protein
MVMAPDIAAAQGPKYSEHRLTITERPSKMSPAPRLSGRSIPSAAVMPNNSPCSRTPTRVVRGARLSTKSDRMVNATSSVRFSSRSRNGTKPGENI